MHARALFHSARRDARRERERERKRENDIYLPVCSSAKLLFEDQIEQTFPGSGFERGNSTSASGPVLEGRAGWGVDAYLKSTES
jgi:hypothetical protein